MMQLDRLCNVVATTEYRPRIPIDVCELKYNCLKDMVHHGGAMPHTIEFEN